MVKIQYFHFSIQRYREDVHNQYLLGCMIMLAGLSLLTLINDLTILTLLTINKFSDKLVDKKQCELFGQVLIFCKLILLSTIIPR